MGQQQYVVKYNDTTDLYMISYDPIYSNCTWGSVDNPSLMIWSTLEAAQNVAASINSGTVGTTKPPH